jgi:probable HAF family extracellular repeat protein
MFTRHRHKAILLLAMLAAPLVAQADVRYGITPIGLPGSMPAGINNSGEVVGYFTSGGAMHAFLYSGTGYVDLGTLGGGSSRAYGINDAGFVVGASANAAGDTHAFIYANGSMTDIGTLGGSYSSAAAINNHGQIAGASDGAAFLYTPGTGMRSLGALSDDGTSRAQGINDAGVVVGGSIVGSGPLPQFHAFMYTSGGGMTDLGPMNSSFSVGQAINERGDIVGWLNAGPDLDHAFLYSAGVMTDLGTLSGFGTSLAYDINNAGQIVGSSEVANRESRAILYEDGAMADLDMLVDPASGWTIQSAYAINDQQQIAAWGCNAGGCQALRLDPLSPVPEPQTHAMLMAGLGLLGWTYRLRKTGIDAGNLGNPGS